MAVKQLPRFSIVKAIQVVGDAWTIKILGGIFRGERRFIDIQAALQISKSALATRLDQMVKNGLLLRVPLPDSRRFEYRLDEAGLDLWEVLLAIRQWELTWYPDTLMARRVMYHTECGEFVEPKLSCNICTAPLTPFNTTAKAGPGAGFDPRPAPIARRRGSAALRDSDGSGMNNSTMLIFGDRWTPAIIATLFRGLSRFNEIEAYLHIPPVILAGRLGDLVELGVLRKRLVNEGQTAEEFRLTRKGLDIFPYIAMLAKWGDQWMSDDHGLPLTFHHKDCGGQYIPVFRCSCCNRPLRRTRVKLFRDANEAEKWTRPSVSGAKPANSTGAEFSRRGTDNILEG